ncbi:Protein-lysine methyltransferase [Fragilaria crotonensis]|nr:Protein-lysine methyltransferase [Fragilaria crotonensis]
MTAEPQKTLIFQDVVVIGTCDASGSHVGESQEQNGQEIRQLQPQPSNHNDHDLSLAFFELANVPIVGYRLASHQQRTRKRMRNKPSDLTVTVHQDTNACGNHTGGIVWETSYLLLNYLLHDRKLKDSTTKRKRFGRVLEVGAGCGLLGLVLAASGWCRQVVLTETETVLDNLLANLKRNTNDCEFSNITKSQRPGKQNAPLPSVVVQKLDWLRYEDDAVQNLDAHSFDTIVGTDVVFTPTLVEPLLQTLRFMAHDTTVVYLCLQIRCEDSHKLLLTKAAAYQWHLDDVSHELAAIPECAWGLAMDCHLLKLTRIVASTTVAVENQECKNDERKRNTVHERTSDEPESSSKKKRKKAKHTM